MTTTDLARSGAVDADIIERVIMEGDLGKLKAEERVSYYREVCRSLGLNPFTKPFDYLVLNGKVTLYAGKNCTDQLRDIHGVHVVKLERDRIDDLYVVTAYLADKTGRTDSDIGAVNVKGMSGDMLANAMMKAVTKAKRRATLSLCGLGWLDESEIETIPTAKVLTVDHETGEVLSEPQREQTTKPTCCECGAGGQYRMKDGTVLCAECALKRKAIAQLGTDEWARNRELSQSAFELGIASKVLNQRTPIDEVKEENDRLEGVIRAYNAGTNLKGDEEAF